MGLNIPENRFKDKPSECFTCSICKDVAKIPTQIDCDDKHIFCAECIGKHVDGSSGSNRLFNECPTCGEDFQNEDQGLVENPTLRVMYNSILVYCEYRQETETGEGGCLIEEKIKDLFNHHDRCNAKVRCQANGHGSCGLPVARNALQRHNCVEALKCKAKDLEREKDKGTGLKLKLDEAEKELQNMKLEKDDHNLKARAFVKQESTLLGERNQYLKVLEGSDPKETLPLTVLQNWSKSITQVLYTQDDFWKNVIVDANSGTAAEISEALKHADCPDKLLEGFLKVIYGQDYTRIVSDAKTKKAKYTARNMRKFQSQKSSVRFYLVTAPENNDVAEPSLRVPFPGLIIVQKR